MLYGKIMDYCLFGLKFDITKINGVSLNEYFDNKIESLLKENINVYNQSISNGLEVVLKEILSSDVDVQISNYLDEKIVKCIKQVININKTLDTGK